ncbi:hypothetical protein Avbf_02022 [Armadillidium vulgare]|nr:hypothetical protein Avbf_02022 [Armadillidium vulgare]
MQSLFYSNTISNKELRNRTKMEEVEFSWACMEGKTIIVRWTPGGRETGWNMEKNSGGGPKQNGVDLGRSKGDGSGQTEVEGFDSCPIVKLQCHIVSRQTGHQQCLRNMLFAYKAM